MIAFRTDLIGFQANTGSTINNLGVPEDNRTPSQKADSDTEAVKLTLSPQAQKLLQSTNTKADDGKKLRPDQASTENNQSLTSSTLKKPVSSPNRQFSAEELRIINKLAATDLHVKMHEQQHIAAGGAYVVGGPSYTFTTGPDGKNYAVGGEVQLDTSPIPNNPQATISKAATIRQAALAPADPSGADRSVAVAATQMEAKARAELAEKSAAATGTASSRNSENNAWDRKVQAYKNILKPNQTGRFFNKIA